MIKFGVKNVKTMKEIQEIQKIFEGFNKDKENIWVLRSWVSVEAIDALDTPKKVIYIEDTKGTKKDKILEVLKEKYNLIGGDEAFKKETIWIPTDQISIEIIGNSKEEKPICNTASFPIVLYKVKNTNGLGPAQAFDLVAHVKEMYDNEGLIVKDTEKGEEVYTLNTKIWVPEDWLDVEVKYI